MRRAGWLLVLAACDGAGEKPDETGAPVDLPVWDTDGSDAYDPLPTAIALIDVRHEGGNSTASAHFYRPLDDERTVTVVAGCNVIMADQAGSASRLVLNVPADDVEMTIGGERVPLAGKDGDLSATLDTWPVGSAVSVEVTGSEFPSLVYTDAVTVPPVPETPVVPATVRRDEALEVTWTPGVFGMSLIFSTDAANVECPVDDAAGTASAPLEATALLGTGPGTVELYRHMVAVTDLGAGRFVYVSAVAGATTATTFE